MAQHKIATDNLLCGCSWIYSPQIPLLLPALCSVSSIFPGWCPCLWHHCLSYFQNSSYYVENMQKFIYTCAKWPYVQQNDEQNFLLFNKILQICFICPDLFSLTSPGTIIWKVIVFLLTANRILRAQVFWVQIDFDWFKLPHGCEAPQHCRSTPQSSYNLSTLSLSAFST